MRKGKISRSAPVLDIDPRATNKAVSRLQSLPSIEGIKEDEKQSPPGEGSTEGQARAESKDCVRSSNCNISEPKEAEGERCIEEVVDKAGSLYSSGVDMLSSSEETVVTRPTALALTIGKRTKSNLRSATVDKLSSTASVAAGIHMEENNFNREGQNESDAFAKRHLAFVAHTYCT